MDDAKPEQDELELLEIESPFGREDALSILRVLEQFEGVEEKQVAELSFEKRVLNVLQLMRGNGRNQTKH